MTKPVRLSNKEVVEPVKVVFKCEDFNDDTGEEIGKVTLLYSPPRGGEGIHRFEGWYPLSEARKLARQAGVPLEVF